MPLCKPHNIVKCDVFDGVFRVTRSVNGDGVSM
ncbi:long tail fiber p37 domain protein, partial [Escherichia coli 2860650]